MAKSVDRSRAADLIKRLKAQKSAPGAKMLHAIVDVAEGLFADQRYKSVERLIATRVESFEKRRKESAEREARRAAAAIAKKEAALKRAARLQAKKVAAIKREAIAKVRREQAERDRVARAERGLDTLSESSIPAFLRAARVGAGITQSQAAKFLGHSTSQYLSNLERGLCLPSVEMTIRLADFYGASRADLYALMLGDYQRSLRKRFKF